MSRDGRRIPYATRSSVSHTGRQLKEDLEYDNDLVAGLFYRKLHEIKNPTDVPKTKTARASQANRGPILYFDSTSSDTVGKQHNNSIATTTNDHSISMATNNEIKYEYESDASNEDSESDQEKSFNGDYEDDEDHTTVKADSKSDAVEVDEAEQTDEDLDKAILAGVDDLLARVNVTLNNEERCWYELEATHCRNRRLPFILKSELDVLETVKNHEIKEMFETLIEVASHYKDTLAREKALEEENVQLKARLESNTNILLGNIGFRYASDDESYDDAMADAPSA